MTVLVFFKISSFLHFFCFFSGSRVLINFFSGELFVEAFCNHTAFRGFSDE